MHDTEPLMTAPPRGSSTPPPRTDFRFGFPASLADLDAWDEYAAGPWVLELPWDLNPLPANGSRGHWATHAKKVRLVRRVTWALATEARIPARERVTVQLTYYVRDRRRRDVDNLAPLLKPIKDGLVDAGIVPDDTPELMATPMPTIVLLHPTAAASAFFQVHIADWPRSVA